MALKVLIVDDEPPNLRVLRGLLAPLEYDVREAKDGRETLAAVAADPPDIVLLDVMMPGMTGFDVCKKLKSDPGTQFIPVVLVTALSDRDSRIQGIESGADDFLNKPVDAIELRARVRSLLHSKSLHDELEERYGELQALEQMRESLTQMIVHDLRNPLAAVVGFLELMMLQDFISEDSSAQAMAQKIKMNAQVMMDMTTALLDLAKLEAGEMKLDFDTVVLQDVMNDVEAGVGALMAQKELEFQVQQSDPSLKLQADREILRRILVNIIGNAVKFSPVKGCITLSAVPDGNHIRIDIKDEGPGIPEAFLDKIFEKFGQVEANQSQEMISTGLGLAFCKLAVEAHGGEVGVESEVDKGSTFWFTIKKAG